MNTLNYGKINKSFIQLVLKLSKMFPQIVDEIIEAQEPLYSKLNKKRKVKVRDAFCKLNPSFIYKEYKELLNEIEKELKNQLN